VGGAFGHLLLRASKLDGVEKRWRQLVGPQSRERGCSFRCSTVCAR